MHCIAAADGVLITLENPHDFLELWDPHPPHSLSLHCIARVLNATKHMSRWPGGLLRDPRIVDLIPGGTYTFSLNFSLVLRSFQLSGALAWPFTCLSFWLHGDCGKAGPFNLRFTTPVGWLLSLQLTVLGRSVIVVYPNVFVASFCNFTHAFSVV